MRGDRKRITHRPDPRTGTCGCCRPSVKTRNREYKNADRKLAINAEIEELVDQELHEELDHDVAEKCEQERS
jgi:hypothetical protein